MFVNSFATKMFYFIVVFVFVLLDVSVLVQSQFATTNKQQTDARIRELHTLAIRVENSVNLDKYACDSFYDYVCSRNRPVFSVMGHMPESSELISLLSQLQDDTESFVSKDKVTDFFISCNILKFIEDCYRETFEYFKPYFGYVIAKNHLDSHDHKVFLEILDRFLIRADHTDNLGRSHLKYQMEILKEQFRYPQIYFRIDDLNLEYKDLVIYRESYHHNVRNLELHRRKNSTYTHGVARTMLDWTLFLYQSRNKPMSYYFPTFNVHLWMVLYNATARDRDIKRFNDIADCLKLPSYVNILEEGRILAVIYLKSLLNAWQEYRDWIRLSSANQHIYDYEEEVLKHFKSNNKRIFFTLFAQNFCDFGKELAENIFYLGLKQNADFINTYSCGIQSLDGQECV